MCSFRQSRCSVMSWRWQEEAVISKVDQGGCLVWHSPEAQLVPGYPTYTLPLLRAGPLFSSLSLPISVYSYFQTTVFIFTAFSCFQKIPWPAQSTSLSPLFSIDLHFTFLVWVGYVHIGKGHVRCSWTLHSAHEMLCPESSVFCITNSEISTSKRVFYSLGGELIPGRSGNIWRKLGFN